MLNGYIQYHPQYSYYQTIRDFASNPMRKTQNLIVMYQLLRKKINNMKAHEIYVGFQKMLQPGTWIRIDYTHQPTGITYDHDAIVTHTSSDLAEFSIIHFAKVNDKLQITESDLPSFLKDGKNPRIVQEPVHCYSDDVIVQRARSQLGTANYHVLGKNCQHFARWCCTGKAFSHEIYDYGVLLSGVGICILAIGSCFIMLSRQQNFPKYNIR